MKNIAVYLFFFLTFLIPNLSSATINVGIGKTDITPPIGTPSAGYTDRKGIGMQGIHDPLLAIALFIDNGVKQIVLCSVDHLGFTYEMTQDIVQQIHSTPQLEQCEIYISSSHTHSGGGAYLNIPLLGQSLAGTYNADIANFYVIRTVEAIIQASQNQSPSKIGIGYGSAGNLSKYRGLWPTNISPLTDVAVLKFTKLDNTPFAVLFNYAVHPTLLKSQNLLFSSDFVGYARDHLQSLLGSNVQPIYFNGAQGDIIPVVFNEEDRFASCAYLGRSLAEAVQKIWNEVETQDTLDIKTQREQYAFKPLATPFGMNLPIDQYKSEMNLIILNQMHAFITIPGELSSIYDQRLKEIGKGLGYQHVSIFGLTNDAHGYIILPEAWEHKTFESRLSFGGKNYGELTKNRAENLLKSNISN
ncbi:MAG: neutral/alkaline non-lysosomal ceramidase N-terminal domain-containing protein [Parachlamydiaceae bacterium]|nr:neutral/alkaline non-lysosomal ceramidase N-terminal domain-containing protein [Parachlamydiaceae bacterium]